MGRALRRVPSIGFVGLTIVSTENLTVIWFTVMGVCG